MSSYSEAVAAGAARNAAAAAAANTRCSGAAPAQARASGGRGARTCCALDAAAYYGLLPAFKLLLEACKRKLTLHQSKSCAAAAAAADQVSILQQLHADVICDTDDMFWPEAAAVAAACDHSSSVTYLLSASSRSWTQPLACSVSPCPRSNLLHVAAAHTANRVIASCCSLARASLASTRCPATRPRADAQSLGPWSQLFLSPDTNGCHPLHVAIRSGCSDAAIAAMVSCETGTLDARDGSGSTPLHAACASMRLDTVKVLLSMGASRLLKDARGQSAAAAAVDACSAQQTQLTDPATRAALQQRCLSIIKLLFETPPNPAAAAPSAAAIAASLMAAPAPSSDPLVVAAARVSIDDVVAYLLDLDPSCSRAKGRGGHSVLDVYLSNKSSSGLDLLQQRSLMSAMDYASASRRNAGFDPARTLKPYWQAK